MIVPLSTEEFTNLMEGLGPFESQPLLAVAVSGGRDSMALCLMADRWVKTIGGRIVALSVDHGLRKESADEVRQVGAWMKPLGIEHHILRWQGEKPTSGLQEKARLERYRLLQDWCAERGILHLLLAHHQDDQAETLLLRYLRGSGLVGLSGMSAIVENRSVRLLRPLLGIPGARLSATLKAFHQDWVEDPSNKNEGFERVRLRTALATAPDLKKQLVKAGSAAAAQRLVLEDGLSTLLARYVFVSPLGFVRVKASLFDDVPIEIFCHVIDRLAVSVGGKAYGPRRDRLAAAAEKLVSLRDNVRFTLGGCQFYGKADYVEITREYRNAPLPVLVDAQSRLRWDGRFSLRFAGRGKALVGPLGRDGLRKIFQLDPGLREKRIPHGALLMLPALYTLEGKEVLQVAALNVVDETLGNGSLKMMKATFEPTKSLSGPGFCLA